MIDIRMRLIRGLTGTISKVSLSLFLASYTLGGFCGEDDPKDIVISLEYSAFVEEILDKKKQLTERNHVSGKCSRSFC